MTIYIPESSLEYYATHCTARYTLLWPKSLNEVKAAGYDVFARGEFNYVNCQVCYTYDPQTQQFIKDRRVLAGVPCIRIRKTI